MTASRYKIIRSLKDSRYCIEDKETGELTEPFILDDIEVDRIGMYEDLRSVYSCRITLNMQRLGGWEVGRLALPPGC